MKIAPGQFMIMENRIATYISCIFHPVILPVYLLIIILNLDTFYVNIIPSNAKWLMAGMIVLAAVALPLLMFLLLLRHGLIPSSTMENRRERIRPYILMALIYYLMFMLFRSVNIPGIVLNLLLGVFIILLLSFLINFRWKISIHMAGMGGAAGLLLGIAFRYYVDLRILLVITIIMAGITGYARLKLDAHKPSEIYSGFLLGTFVMLMLYIFA